MKRQKMLPRFSVVVAPAFICAVWPMFLVRAQTTETKAGEIAASYPNDAGIAKDKRVIFADDFDAWETNTAKFPSKSWDILRNDKNPQQRQTLAVGGKVTVNGRSCPARTFSC